MGTREGESAWDSSAAGAGGGGCQKWDWKPSSTGVWSVSVGANSVMFNHFSALVPTGVYLTG